MKPFVINFRDDDDRLRGTANVRVVDLAEACIWARAMMTAGQRALIYRDDNLLCILIRDLDEATIH